MTTPLGWRDRAACRDQWPDLWFPHESDTHHRQQAITICTACPVQTECANYARQHRITDGIWGGQDRGKPRPGPGRPPAACGTESGYRRHIRIKEPVCDDCKAAAKTAAKNRPSYKTARSAGVNA